jgi:hypothetical protein
MANLASGIFAGMERAMARSGLGGSVADISIGRTFGKAARKPTPVSFFGQAAAPEHQSLSL